MPNGFALIPKYMFKKGSDFPAFLRGTDLFLLSVYHIRWMIAAFFESLV